LLTRTRWDDWVPAERIRKLNDENKELASNLKKENDAQRRAASGKSSLASTAGRRRGLGSDAPGSSARGSEDRNSAAPPPPPRGRKRGAGEIEGIEKVCLTFDVSFVFLLSWLVSLRWRETSALQYALHYAWPQAKMAVGY
jgi:hypothetical protein